MKTTFTTLGFALGASAALIGREQCCFSLSASGGASGDISQLGDGQNRIGATGADSTAAQYCISAQGGLTDGNGRGCILTPPTTQFQCDEGATPQTGFSVGSNGDLEYNGSTKFYACADSDSEDNIYTSTSDAQTRCKEISLNTNGQCQGSGQGNGASSVAAASTAASSAASYASSTSASSVISSGASSALSAASSAASSASSTAASVASVVSSASSATLSAGTTTPVGYSNSAGAASSASSYVASSSNGQSTQSVPATTSVSAGSSQSAPVSSNCDQAARETVTITRTIQASCENEVCQTSATIPVASTPVVSLPAQSTTQDVTLPAYPTTVVSAASSTLVPSAPAPSAPASSGPAPSGPAPSGPASSAPASSAPASSGPAPSAPASSAPASSAPVASSSAPSAAPPASSAPAPSGTQPASGASACQSELSGAYQTPHLIVPVSSEAPDTAYGTSYNGQINSTTSTVFNFDIPQSYEGKQCTVIFLFPKKEDLETSDYTLSGSGGLTFSQLKNAVDEQTSYSSLPAVESQIGEIADLKPGNSYVVASGPCAAGQKESIEVESSGDLALNFFEDWNPSPLGLYITSC